ncbi:MAG: hypothetical protein LBN27_05190, partial [Prevotellaceae bacterium]|nr:hypothetical protein [Prevotellaceae bacterium]
GAKAPPLRSYAANLAGNIYLCKLSMHFIFKYLFFSPESLRNLKTQQEKFIRRNRGDDYCYTKKLEIIIGYSTQCAAYRGTGFSILAVFHYTCILLFLQKHLIVADIVTYNSSRDTKRLKYVTYSQKRGR